MNCHFNGCKNLVKFFNNTEIKTFIQVGSSLEYGNKTSPQSENERCNPRGSYGLSKYKASNFLKNFGKLYNFPYIIIRPYQIYGPNQKKNRLIPQTIEACLKNKKFDCTDGLQKRDFLFIDDFVDLIKKILKNKKIRKEIFNVGYGKPIKVRNIIEKIKKIIKKGKPKYGSIKMRKDEILKLYPNTRKVKKFFNWTPKIPINIGLKKTIRHYNEMRKSDDLVSVIINCHNGEKYLKQCVESVIDQTYRNWEIIFLDNFSNDNSVFTINSYKDKRIKVYKTNKFLNLYKARNEAVKKSMGKYICFLDTDDYWEKSKIENQLYFIQENPEYAMIYSNYYIFNQKKNKKFLMSDYELPYGNIIKKILKDYSIGILTVFIKKEIFENQSFNPELSILGDFDFFVRISNDYKIGCIQKPLATYRVHENNYSKINIKKYIIELKNWIDKNEIIFKKKGLNLYNQKYLLLKLRLKKILNYFSFLEKYI